MQKSLFFFGVIAIIFTPLILADNASKVKLIGYAGRIINPEYFGEFRKTFVKVNETYNRLQFDGTVLKDFPLDTNSTAEVFRAEKSSNCLNYQKLNEYTASLCSHENDKYDAYLPTLFQQLKKAGKCLEKGPTSTYSMDFFKFYNLLPEKDLKNACFKLIVTYSSKNVIFVQDQFEFVTNDKN